MSSLPPLGRDPDPLAQSFALLRSKALGGRVTRARQSPLSRNAASPLSRSERIGPRTVIRPPIALLGRVLSEKEVSKVSKRFPLTSHRLRRADPQPMESASAPVLEPLRPQLEEFKVAAAEEGDVAAKMKVIQQTLSVFSLKALGEGHRPEAREGASMVTINRKMYLFGGRCRVLFNDVKALDPESLRWEHHRATQTLEGPPEPRMNHAAVAFKNWMVVYGGCDRFNDTLQFRNCFPLLHFYDTLTHTWNNAKLAGGSPEPRRNHCAAVVGRSLFVYGGIDRLGRTLDDLVGANLESLVWFTPTVLRRQRPGALSGATLTAAYSPQTNGFFNFDIFCPPKLFDDVFTLKTSGVYLFGGLSDQGVATNDVYVLQPKKKTPKDDRQLLSWTKLDLGGVVPEPRHSHSACLCGKFIYIMGGRNDSLFTQESRCELKSFALLNVESQRWDRLEIVGSVPSGRWGHSSSSIGSKLVLFGGMKLSKYCSSKVFLLETDPAAAKDRIAHWREESREVRRR